MSNFDKILFVALGISFLINLVAAFVYKFSFDDMDLANWHLISSLLSLFLASAIKGDYK